MKWGTLACYLTGTNHARDVSLGSSGVEQIALHKPPNPLPLRTGFEESIAGYCPGRSRCFRVLVILQKGPRYVLDYIGLMNEQGYNAIIVSRIESNQRFFGTV